MAIFMRSQRIFGIVQVDGVQTAKPDNTIKLSENRVWIYDITLDACTRMPGHTAYTAQGSVMRYNGDLADGEYCVM